MNRSRATLLVALITPIGCAVGLSTGAFVVHVLGFSPDDVARLSNNWLVVALMGLASAVIDWLVATKLAARS